MLSTKCIICRDNDVNVLRYTYKSRRVVISVCFGVSKCYK